MTISIVLGGEGQGEGKGAALVGAGAGDPYAPTVGLNQIISDGQTDPAAAACSGTRLFHPVEALEDVGEVLSRDADARARNSITTSRPSRQARTVT